MSKWVKIVAAAIAVTALVILAYAVLTPEEDTETSGPGMGSHMSYTTSDVGVIAFSISAVVISLMVMLLWKEYEPLPPNMVPTPPPAKTELVAEVKPETPAAPPPECPPEPHPSPDEAAERNYLVLRLLTGDERAMFKAIMDSGGEALQKDLILRTKMSNAKVSRLLDRLAQKGVVTKERYGSTNMVKIKPGA